MHELIFGVELGNSLAEFVGGEGLEAVGGVDGLEGFVGADGDFLVGETLDGGEVCGVEAEA